ncbi:PilZ domain-containing protein [Shewanella acanthi]|uniref:PilZ domain-containing protein n=1 Tax=Shewanella acanthi TaxID=2864212 RepID=UPI001C65CBBE|nr:PilZ domain-containing protein [Shewanella acanthi]QYJ80535.1 PilZ domain-containing protein [Shewanella acanthi]
MDDRRKFSRILFAATASLQQGEHHWQTTLLDLCLNGALVEVPANFNGSNDPITLTFTLPGSDIELHMDTQVVHHRNGQFGLQCHAIDVESISHLKRIVELNLGDASLLHREFGQFIEQHSIAE